MQCNEKGGLAVQAMNAVFLANKDGVQRWGVSAWACITACSPPAMVGLVFKRRAHAGMLVSFPRA